MNEKIESLIKLHFKYMPKCHRINKIVFYHFLSGAKKWRVSDGIQIAEGIPSMLVFSISFRIFEDLQKTKISYIINYEEKEN